MSLKPSYGWTTSSVAPGEREAMRLVWNGCVDSTAISPERLFEALDGRVVTVSGRQWRIVVYSVSEDGDSMWIQLGLEGSPPFSVMVETRPEHGPKEAISMLSSWLANGTKGHVLRSA